MNLKDIPKERPPLRGLQKEVEQLRKQNTQLEAENAWLRKILAEMQHEDKVAFKNKKG